MRTSTLIIVSVLFALLSNAAHASIQVGDTIRFINRPGSPGGEFGVAKAPGNAELFVSFCLERNEFLDFNSAGFVIDSISKVAENGGQGGRIEALNGDPLDARTAWLYYNFTKGTLAGYDGSETSANKLQHAIWRIEEENFHASTSQDYYDLANSASVTELADALSQVYVVNISWATARHGIAEGAQAQSVLYVIPEATTVVVWSALSVIGLTMYRRRSK